MTREEKAIWKYWSNHQFSAKARGKRVFLTAFDIVHLLEEAGITVWDIGQGEEDYCLARHGDTGPYKIGNCRFITQRENQLEWEENQRLDQKRKQDIEERAREEGKKGSKWGFLGPLGLKKKEVLEDFSLIEKRKRARGLQLLTPTTLEELLD